MTSGESNFKGILLIFNGIIVIFLAFKILSSDLLFLLCFICFLILGLVLIKLGYDNINNVAVEKLTAAKIPAVIANKDENSFNNPITNVDVNFENAEKLPPEIANKDENSFNNPITNVDNNLEKKGSCLQNKESDIIKFDKIYGYEDFTISGNYIDDIKRCRTLKGRTMILEEIFIRYQATCKDTTSFKELYFKLIDEIPGKKNDDFFYLDRLSLKAMDILVERIYINREKDFSLDDNIKSVFSTCFYYFINNFEQDWTDTTRYCRNDVKSYIYNIPELRSIYEKDLQNIHIEKGVPGAIGPVAGGLLDEKKIKNTYGELVFRCHINGNYIDDINISKDKDGKSSILIKIFLHYQKMQKDTNSYKELFLAVFDEIEESFYDALSIYALDFLIGELYVKKEKSFTLDDIIRSVLSTCFYYYAHNFTQDLGERTKYCINDIDFFIKSIPELQSLREEVLKRNELKGDYYMQNKLIGLNSPDLRKKTFEGFIFSDNYIDDIKKSETEGWTRSITLIDIFVHHQKKCKNTASYKELFFAVLDELHVSLYDKLSVEALDNLIERIYIKQETGFVLDDNIKSVLSTALYYYGHDFPQDWGDKTRYCKNDIEFFIKSIPELQSLLTEALKKK